MKAGALLAILLVGCQSAPVKELGACHVELRATATERDVIGLQAQKIVEDAQHQDAQHQRDKAKAIEYFRQLQLYCPKVGT